MVHGHPLTPFTRLVFVGDITSSLTHSGGPTRRGVQADLWLARSWGREPEQIHSVIVAVAADAVEGVSLLKVLRRTRVGVHARRAQIAALIKFAVLAGALGYLASGLSPGRRT